MDSCSVEGEIKAVRETQSYNPAGVSSDAHTPANLASFFFFFSALNLFHIEALLHPLLVSFLSSMLPTHFHVSLPQI